MNRIRECVYLNWMTLRFLIHTYPFRAFRLVVHFFQWIPFFKKFHLPSKGIVEWFGDLLFYLLDVLIVPDLLEIIYVWIQPKVRRIHDSEIPYVEKYFNKQVNFRYIKMCNSMPQRIARLADAFVSFNIIHFNSEISSPVLVHELVHVWQYQKFGSVYIFRALKAQKSMVGYDYGGLEALYHRMLDNFVFTEFNFEQQGEIFEDYCRLQESNETVNPLWLASFEYFIEQVRGSEVA
ncbi:MAG: hypothetical protein P1U56_23865 [Saprospiraceae bacterium]|nr:hypothetical protein [Saprospiraceae bacterium]